MSRFVSRASFEENTLDPNENNPLLNTEDPAKQAEENGAEVAKEFEYIEDEVVENEKLREDEVIFDGEVEDKVTEVDNIVNETTKVSEVNAALSDVALEMLRIVQDKGRLTVSEMSMVKTTVSSLESMLPYVEEDAFPSLESYREAEAAQYSQTEVSLEGVFSKIERGLNNIMLNVERVMSNGVGLARSMTPIINSRLAQITNLRSKLKDANRNDGQKEVSGAFVRKLSVDGNTPNAETVVKTTTYLNECMGEILSASGTDSAVKLLKNAMTEITRAADRTTEEDDHISPLWLLIFNPELVAAFALEKTAKRIKIDGNMSPEFFKLYPSVAKVNHTFGDVKADKNLEIRRSLPLFNNKALVISQYRRDVEVGAGNHSIPKLTLVKFGEGAGDKSMQSLTHGQQLNVLDLSEQLLLKSRDYYKTYANRSKAAMQHYKEVFKLAQKYRDANTGFGHTKKQVTVMVTLRLIDYYSRIYWMGLFQEQSKMAIYGRKTASNLIDLVLASNQTAAVDSE